MPNDFRPGEFPKRDMPNLILKEPLVLTSDNSPPVLLGSPPSRLLGVSAFHVALCTVIHEIVQCGESLLGHPSAKVVAPAPDQRVHLVDQSHSRSPYMFAPEPFQFPFQFGDGVRARFNQQLVAAARAVGSGIMPNVEAQEIEALSQVTNMGFLI